MRSSSELEVPAVWQRKPLMMYWLVSAGLSITSLLALSISGYLFVTAQPYLAVMALFFALGLVSMFTVGVDARLRRSKSGVSMLSVARDSNGTGALKVPYSSIQFYGLTVIMASFGLSFVTGFIASLYSPSFGFNGAPIFALVGLFFLSFPVLVLSGSFARGYLLIGPHGIYQRGWTFDAYLPWSSINNIEPKRYNGPEIWALAGESDPEWRARQITRLWRQDRVPTYPMIRVAARNLGIDPVLVYYILGFYLLHEEQHSELNSDAVLDRIRRGMLG